MNKKTGTTGPEPQAVENFIERWRDTGGKERSNYQLFLTELCRLLDLPGPEPAGPDPSKNAYVFERRVEIHHPDGTSTRGFIDLYKRGHFVLEAKRITDKRESSAWDKAMLRAAAQADTYIRALPAGEGRPPFLLTCDVGKTIEVYAEFSRSGATYVPFPDPRSHRIHLNDLREEEVRDRLVRIWTDPDSLDPARQTAEVTREIALRLARLARSLEKDHGPGPVAGFLMRCLFTMFSEDVGLLPNGSFTSLLESLEDDPRMFAPMLESLWSHMNTGGFSAELRTDLLRFNGGLFADNHALQLDSEQIRLLIDAARADWQYVEPAIFGTLLERALDPIERHKLGAHYTPRAYVERLVMPTIIDPLRDEWKNVQAAAATLEAQDKHKRAVKEIREFHHKLCDIRVLDPACGTGNFLYVTLEHMKRLEGEVLNTLRDLTGSQDVFEMAGITVDPHQFKGLEINPRAAAIAEMVLWIGYLQWHFRTHGHVNPPQPVLRAFENIECRDAVLDYDKIEFATDEQGKPVTRWDGKTYKKSSTTGEDIPDESAQVPVEVYVNPRKAEWPEADYVVGNPPFIGAGGMRRALGDGYVEALRKTWNELPESCDFVMYWWHIAAELTRAGKLQQFGLITTNSLRQTFNRRVIKQHLSDKKPLSLAFALPDHPWVDSSEGAAVRIAMTVGTAGEHPGILGQLTDERKTDKDTRKLTFRWRHGKVHSNLAIGADTASAVALEANQEISSPGVKLHGSGFIVTPEDASALGLGKTRGIEEHIRQYRNGRDITQTPRGVMVIDLFGLNPDQVRERFPHVYQWVVERVKPERDQNKRATYRDNWWIFGEPRRVWRAMSDGIQRYIATVETSKHRFFQFLDKEILPDNKLICIALEHPLFLGVLSSCIHITWAERSGGNLGMGNDPVYVKTRCFETFPFPETTPETEKPIAQLAEQIDAHRKRQQEQHPGLTLTGLYNVLEKLRREESLTKKEKEIHEQGLVSVLRELHDDLDRAVFAAYGWDDLADKLVGRPGATTPWPEKPEDQQQAEEELLQRLVGLNHRCAAEEATGKIRWLRPDYQAPSETTDQTELETGETTPTAATAAPAAKLTWPKILQEQVRVIRDQLSTGPMTVTALASNFKRKPEKSVIQVLEALTELGMVQSDAEECYRLRDA